MTETDSLDRGITRRRMLLAGMAMGIANTPFGALAGMLDERECRLGFNNVRTGEELEITYRVGRHYIPAALNRIDHLLRDVLSGEVKPIDPRLLDLLYCVRRDLDTEEPYAVISGYRSPRSNRLLAKRKSGVAKKSLHIEGMAVDLLLPGRDLDAVAETAKSFHAGGVGYYPKSKFVHLDVGRPRYWSVDTS